MQCACQRISCGMPVAAAGVPAQLPCCAALAAQLSPARPAARAGGTFGDLQRGRLLHLASPHGRCQHRGRIRVPANQSTSGAAAEQAPELSRPGSDWGADRAQHGGAGPDMPTSYVQLQPPEGGAAIHLFGVVHGGHESEVGEFILRQRPELVVVETALNAAHGSAHGNTVCRQDCLTFTHSTAPGSTDHRARTFAHYGVQLADMPHPLGSHLWNDLSQGSHSLYNEQLVYVAAFAVSAELVFGDRPKEVTYSRMLWLPSIVDLDHAFANMSASNYKDLVQPRAPAPPAPEPSETMTPVLGSRAEAALLGERDAILLSAVHKASLQCGSRASIVCVVGASHVAGMEQLWKSGRWRGMVAGQALLQAPSGPRRPETTEDAGVRRALLEGVIRLTCRTDVQQDVQRVLGAVPAESREAYSLAHELYGNARMLLAVLNREQLQEVCLGWRCEMWDLLAPVRAARPVNGGSGIDRELVLELRTLNFEIG